MKDLNFSAKIHINSHTAKRINQKVHAKRKEITNLSPTNISSKVAVPSF